MSTHVSNCCQSSYKVGTWGSPFSLLVRGRENTCFNKHFQKLMKNQESFSHLSKCCHMLSQAQLLPLSLPCHPKRPNSEEKTSKPFPSRRILKPLLNQHHYSSLPHPYHSIAGVPGFHPLPKHLWGAWLSPLTKASLACCARPRVSSHFRNQHSLPFHLSY